MFWAMANFPSFMPTHDVRRWNETHHGGKRCDFVKRKGALVHKTPESEDRAKLRAAEGFEFYFGKHRHKKLKDVPTGYLEWIQENFKPDKRNRKLLSHISTILESRK